jgi:hypothetical protein
VICDVVGLMEHGTTRGFLDVSGAFLQLGRSAGANGDARAFARLFLGDGAAKSFAGGRNDSYAALKPQVQICTSSKPFILS